MPRPKAIPGPFSLSAAPAPRLTEGSMLNIAQVMSGRDWSSPEEMNAFLQSPEGQQALASAQPTTSLGRAQAVAMQAWESEPPRRYNLARQALTIDARCSDAWLILAETEAAWRKQRRCFERAVAAAEQAAADEGWLADADPSASLYVRTEARPLLRALVALARCQAGGGYLAEAVATYDRVLALDREDHVGVRYEMVTIYHRQEDLPALRRLLRRFGADDTCWFAYERLWLALVQGRAARVIAALARKAEAANPHVPDFLVGAGNPVDTDSPYVTLGGEEEAAVYAQVARSWWLTEPAARDWLE